MLLINLFTKKCCHEHIAPDVDKAYCPDCGKLVKNQWYITRCSCCGVKLRAVVKNNRVVPQSNYCTNCGSSDFNVEKLEKINFIDINFAVLVKQELDECSNCMKTTRLWAEKTDMPPKLLMQYS